MYEAMSMTELFTQYVSNWKVLATALQEILGDEPFPDPREMARLLAEMPEQAWEAMFNDMEARAGLKKQMDLIKLTSEIQVENAAILEAALNK